MSENFPTPQTHLFRGIFVLETSKTTAKNPDLCSWLEGIIDPAMISTDLKNTRNESMMGQDGAGGFSAKLIPLSTRRTSPWVCWAISMSHINRYHISWSRLYPFNVMTVTRSPTTLNAFLQPPPKTPTGMIAEVVNWAISHQWKLRSTFNGPPKWLDPLEQILWNSAPKPRQLCLALRQQCLRGDVIPESTVIFRKSTRFFFLHAPKRSTCRILLK